MRTKRNNKRPARDHHKTELFRRERSRFHTTPLSQLLISTDKLCALVLTLVQWSRVSVRGVVTDCLIVKVTSNTKYNKHQTQKTSKGRLLKTASTGSDPPAPCLSGKAWEVESGTTLCLPHNLPATGEETASGCGLAIRRLRFHLFLRTWGGGQRQDSLRQQSLTCFKEN